MSDIKALDVGTVLNQRYRIEARIGSGGYSEVLAAHDQEQDRRVALKVLLKEATEHDPDAVARMRQEAEILRAIDHPNIVSMYDVDYFEGGQFLVMEHIDGVGLDELFEREEPLETERLVPLVRQLLDALNAAHSREILHRDLKPANILVTTDGGDESIKLLDFGVAKAGMLLNTDDPDEGITLVKTRSDNFVGTPRYSAPEMVVGDPPTQASDLFCVGLIVYEALTGEPLIQGKSRSGLMSQLVFPMPFDLGAIADPWPAWLAPVLEKSPTERLQSADEARAALDAIFAPEEADPAPLDDPSLPATNTDADPTQAAAIEEDDEEHYPAFGESPPLLEAERSPHQEGYLAPLVTDGHAHDAPTIERAPPPMEDFENPFAEADEGLNVWRPDTTEREALEQIQRGSNPRAEGSPKDVDASPAEQTSAEQISDQETPADKDWRPLALTAIIITIMVILGVIGYIALVR